MTGSLTGDLVYWTAAAFNFAGVAAGLTVLTRHRARLYNGKLTLWLARRVRRPARDLRQRIYYYGAIGFLAALLTSFTHYDQVTATLPLCVLALTHALPNLDDLLTGDDRWWRRFQALRNRVRWRMTLPAPRPANPGTA